MRTITDATHRVSVARDETAVHQTLWTLTIVFALGVPCALGSAVAGGYILAGRVLAPVGAMADSSESVLA